MIKGSLVDDLILQVIVPTSHSENGWSIQPKRRHDKLQYQVVPPQINFTQYIL